MNTYEKILKQEIAKRYQVEEKDSINRIASDYKTWAKAVVAGKRTKVQKSDWNTPEENRFWTLAVLAELRKKHADRMTINLSEVPGEITWRDLNVLADEYMIELYKVASPYQLVFLYN